MAVLDTAIHAGGLHALVRCLLRCAHAVAGTCRRVDDLGASHLYPPDNLLEALRGDRAGQGKWRICFVWNEGDAEQVEIADYH